MREKQLEVLLECIKVNRVSADSDPFPQYGIECCQSPQSLHLLALPYLGND
uniref:Uncharacterized protein n=1 Tax=Lepeophtheirus salmonis TaxID=72036 RepID=A0A0K2TXS5_LEPSM